MGSIKQVRLLTMISLCPYLWSRLLVFGLEGFMRRIHLQSLWWVSWSRFPLWPWCQCWMNSCGWRFYEVLSLCTKTHSVLLSVLWLFIWKYCLPFTLTTLSAQFESAGFGGYHQFSLFESCYCDWRLVMFSSLSNWLRIYPCGVIAESYSGLIVIWVIGFG